jgi:hypothetical protein
VIKVDAYVVEVLLRDLTGHERCPSAFLVYLYLWGRSTGGNVRRVQLSLRELAEGTGLSKSAVQSAIQLLKRRRLLRAERRHTTAVPSYTLHRPWARWRRNG